MFKFNGKPERCMRKSSKSIYYIDEGNKISYDSVKEASIDLDMSQDTIYRVLRKKIENPNGKYRFEYQRVKTKDF